MTFIFLGQIPRRLRPARSSRRCIPSSVTEISGRHGLPRENPHSLRQVKFQSLSSSLVNANGDTRECGGWTLLAALEKAKEADNVQVAHLVSSLSYLLPQPKTAADASQQHTAPQSSHSSDPAFFSFPNLGDQIQWNKESVIDLLQATLRGRRIDLSTVETLLDASTDHFRKSPRMVALPKLRGDQQVTVVGDLHGSLTDLNTVLGLMGDPSVNNHIVFNGDFADRGEHGVEVIAIVCALVLAFPEHVHINRGNHEDLVLSIAYGLAAEVDHKYGADSFRNLSQKLDNFFRSLPLLTVVEEDALIVHAGPPPPGWSLTRLKQELKPTDSLSSRTSRVAGQIGSDVDILVESCLWSDPDVDEEDGNLVNDFNLAEGLTPNLSRGAGFKFGAKFVKSLLETEGLSRLVRSHEPVHKGCARYTVCEDCNMELFTVFSASRYPFKQGFNDGAILRLKSKGRHSIARYSTEEDEPIIVDFTNIGEERGPQKTPERPDASTIRRALKEATASRRAELERAFEEAGKDIPFRQSMKILIRTLNLEGEGLSQPAPMLALAEALTGENISLDTSLDILRLLDKWQDQQEEGDYDNVPPIVADWLESVFDTVDSNHNDEIDKTEWYSAVDKINANMPMGTQRIDAEVTWQLLDRNGDGFISPSEWSRLAAMTCR